MVNLSSKKVPKTHNGEITVSSVNGVGESGHPHAKWWNWIVMLHHTQKSTQDKLQTLTQDLQLWKS